MTPHSVGMSGRMRIYRPSPSRKLDAGDFQRRVNRIAPGFRPGAQDSYSGRGSETPIIGIILIGFAWAYILASLGSNRNRIDTSLEQGSLSADAQYWIISLLAALLAASLVMLALHLVRAVATRGARRRKSRALVFGALMAFGLFYTPEAIWTTGFDMLDGKSQTFLAAASDMISDALPDIKIDKITFASSGG